MVAEFSKDDLVGSNTHVTGKVITVDGGISQVIGVFDMDVDRGMWYNIVNGLAWTYDSAVTGAGKVGSGLGAGLVRLVALSVVVLVLLVVVLVRLVRCR